MFPHRIDRCRLIELLMKTWREYYPSRETAPQTQKKIAYQAKVSPGTVTNLENLTKSVPIDPSADVDDIKAAKRAVSREQLLKVLKWGLRVDRERADAILWLFDGTPTTADELIRFDPSAPPAPQAADMRARLLAYLNEAALQKFAPSGSQLAEVRLFSANEQGRLEGDRALVELEEEPGQRLLITGRPSHLTIPRDLLLTPGFGAYDAQSPAIVEEMLRITAERLEPLFIPHLKEYGARAIHSKSAIKTYLEGSTLGQPNHARRAHIRHWVDKFLRNSEFKYYEVRLVEETPALEFEIASTKLAMMRGARPAGEGRPLWGHHYIYWKDQASVLQFYLAFERAWDDIGGEENQSKDKIAEWVENLMKSTPS